MAVTRLPTDQESSACGSARALLILYIWSHRPSCNLGSITFRAGGPKESLGAAAMPACPLPEGSLISESEASGKLLDAPCMQAACRKAPKGAWHHCLLTSHETCVSWRAAPAAAASARAAGAAVRRPCRRAPAPPVAPRAPPRSGSAAARFCRPLPRAAPARMIKLSCY